MPYDKPIHRIAIVGTGVIGASWAAQYLPKPTCGSTSTKRGPHSRRSAFREARHGSG